MTYIDVPVTMRVVTTNAILYRVIEEISFHSDPATVQVTMVDEDEPFVRELVGECVVEDFPGPGETVQLEWQQGQQNFIMTEVR